MCNIYNLFNELTEYVINTQRNKAKGVIYSKIRDK
jgi:hypothetical protein